MTGSTHPQPAPGRRRPITRLLAGATALLTAAGLLAVATSAHADAPAVVWSQQVSGTTQDLHAVTYLWNSTSGAVAVGDHGTVLKTTDGGLTWAALDAGTTQNLYAVSSDVDFSNNICADVDTPCLWAAGDAGTIVFSADGGSTWCTQTTGTTADLRGLSVAAPTVTATGAGGAIIQANTDGDTCDAAYASDDSGTTADLNALTPFNTEVADYLQAVGSAGAVAEWGDPTWLPVDSGTSQTLYSSGLLSSNDYTAFDIALAGAGGFFATDTIDPDTGAPGPFTAESTGTTNDLHAIATSFPADASDPSALLDVLAVGDNGTIRFRDGATATWTAETSPVSADLQGIASQYGNPGLIVGSGGTILNLAVPLPATTTTVTASPSNVPFGDPVTLSATVELSPDGSGLPSGTVQFADDSGALGSPVAVTYDPGTGTGQASMITSELPSGTNHVTGAYSGDDVFGPSTSDPIVVSVGLPPGTTPTTTTLASGATVQAGDSATFTATVVSDGGTPTGTVQFKDGSTNLGAAATLAGGSATVTVSTLGIGTHAVSAVYSGDPTFARSTSTDATVAVTPRAWFQQPTRTTQDLHAVTYLQDADHAVAVGDHGTILLSTDGGLHWASEPSGTTENLYAVHEFSNFCGTGDSGPCLWAAGQGGTILFSSNGGTSWCAQVSHTTADLHGISDLDPNDIIVAGTGGVIVRGGGISCSLSYSVKSTGTTEDLNAITYLLGTTALGADGTVLTSSGPSYATVPSGTTSSLYAGAELDTQNGATASAAVAGAGGYFGAHGLDGGSPPPFTSEATGTTHDLHGLASGGYPSAAGTATPDVWAVGDAGTILFRDTSTGSPTWSTLTSPTAADLAGIAYGDSTHALVVGAAGTVLSEAQPAAKSSSTTTLTATPNPGTATKTITVTATVHASGVTPTGTVQFKDGAADIGSPVTVSAGHAATTFKATTGTHHLTAGYSGDAYFSGSTSASLAEPVAADYHDYVERVYVLLTGKTGSPSSVNSSVNYLRNGGSAGHVTQSIALSGAGRSYQVAVFYRAVMGEPASRSAIKSYVHSLKTFRTFEATLLGSTGYYAHVGRSAKKFVDSLYRNALVLGASISKSGERHWVQKLQQGTSRTSVATSFLSSAAAVTRRVTQMYETVFGARPTGLALKTYSATYRNATDDPYRLAAALAATTTFRHRYGI